MKWKSIDDHTAELSLIAKEKRKKLERDRRE